MRKTAALLLALLAGAAHGQPPPGYYDSAQGLVGDPLRAALRDIISPHSVLANSQLWAAFGRTDRKGDGSVWDMYSDAPPGTPPYSYQFVVNQCGTYNSEGDCFNREHTFPVSWFNDVSPANTDLHHIYPADAWVNQQRGSWPYGTVASAAWTSQNGSKRGPCAWPGCSGTVFEPINAYKGDLARAHLYMLTRYMNESVAWPGPVLSAGDWLPWVESLLLAWHADDPVSAKETARNDSVFAIQGNRNPYIDHPEWVTQIWGPGVGIAEHAPPAMWFADRTLHLPSYATRVAVRDGLGRVLLHHDTRTEGQLWTLDLAPGCYIAEMVGTARNGFRFVVH